MRHFKHHHGHGHHHKKHERKHGKHMRHNLGRCLSESELMNIGKSNEEVQEQIRLIVRAFFNRRYRWGRKDDFASCDEGFFVGNDRRWRHHYHRWGHEISGRNLNADGENAEGKRYEEEHTDDYHRFHGRHHHSHHGRYGFHGKGRRHHGVRYGLDGGRFSDEDESSSSDDEKRHWRREKHHHKKHHHGKHVPKGWKGHEGCVFLVNASTMTDDVEEYQNPEVSGNQDYGSSIENQAPFSLQIQEVTENLEKSSLDQTENKNEGTSPEEVQEVTDNLRKSRIVDEEWIVL